jgi:APA family basic amino acid/polyamine antiporter
MLTAPRVYFAMAEDRLFFRAVAYLSPHTHVPVVAVALQGLFAIVIALSGRYEQILSYVISSDFIFFALTASTLFIYRRQATKEQVRYLTPGHPWTTGFFVACCVAIVGGTVLSHPRASFIGWAILASGVPAFLFWSRRRSRAAEA